MSAVADYDSSSLNSNLQDQCKDFSAALVSDVSFKVSASCNKEGDTTGVVASSLNSASFDLSGDVQWDTDNQVLSWDQVLTDTVTDIADKCRPSSSTPFTISTTDVTLALTCPISVTDGTPRTASATLGLNGNLKVGTDGSLSRR